MYDADLEELVPFVQLLWRPAAAAAEGAASGRAATAGVDGLRRVEPLPPA